MNRRFLIIAVAIIGILLGLIRATDTTDIATTTAPDWYSRVADVDAALSASGNTRLQGSARALDGGLIFPKPFLAPGSAEALAAAAAANGAVEGEPPVPTIIAAGVIDGIPGIQLTEGKGKAVQMSTVRVGEATPGGWTLVATDLSTAELVWKDVTRTLDIRPAAPLGRSSRNRNNPRQR